MAIVSTKPPVAPPGIADLVPLPPMEGLSRAWVSRLKWYFHHAHRGGAAALPDHVDLELSVGGFVHRVHERLGGVYYAITPRGEAMVAAIREHVRAQRAPHHELGTHLAQWLSTQGRMTWENCSFDVQVGGVTVCARPDVFSTACTLNMDKLTQQVHEVKVSRADFLGDIKHPEKREAYFQLAPRVFYATPFGLVSKEEVPAECGWVEQSQDGTGWFVRKAAPKRKQWKPWTDRMWMTLVLRSHAGIKGLSLSGDT